MKRDEVINAYIKKYNYKSYLEIGVQKGLNFDKIKCDVKVGVDPEPFVPVTYKMTSDDFFKINKKKFDIIFIDGLHEFKQVEKDIYNSLGILNEGGIIICHDMLPPTKEHQMVPRIQKEWNGDCWKAFARLRKEHFYIEQLTIDADWGLGIIKKGEQDYYNKEVLLTWEWFEKNKKEIMNIVSVEEWKRLM